MCRQFLAVRAKATGPSFDNGSIRDAAETGRIQMTAIGGLTQLMMGVREMEQSKAFYADVMGLAVTLDYGKGKAHWVNTSFPDGGVTLTLTTFLGDHLHPGTMSLYIAARDIQQAYDELTARGVEPTDPISDDLYGPGSGVRWFRCTDPDGNVLTFAESK